MCKRQSLMWQKLFIFNKSGFRSRYSFSLSDQWDPRIKIMLVRRFGSGIYHEFSSLVKLQGLNYSNLSVMRMKIKVFQCFSWWTKKKKKWKNSMERPKYPDHLWCKYLLEVEDIWGQIAASPSEVQLPTSGPHAGDECLCCQLMTPGLWLVTVSWWDSVHFCIIL